MNFYCEANSGPELYCCIVNGHDELHPDWLVSQDETTIEFNSGTNYAVLVDGNEIRFVQDDTIHELENLYICSSYTFLKYRLDNTSPDYIILDADNTRLMVNTDGYVLDEENEPIASQRIFNPNELDEEKFQGASRCDFWEAKSDWVRKTLQSDFLKDIALRLSDETE